ncbi:restriction endonuclease subunit S [Vibrio sp. Vb2135]|uniref:restriction endonuclease subunit S n=1 Tax=Vibrio sp. Vb2135 TaxID=3074653 RepID=UPI0029644CAA|nr:restriction endonuclease subunit S [Vibrio sp. Vb2135]MDW1764824.1 restriction endonuclease subunit S [Vibrio sp. Vb2135]
MTSSVKFSEIAELVMGQSPKGADCNETGDGFPLLNGPTEFTERSPLPVQFTTAGKKFSKTGDILFCVRGSTTGRMNYADQAYAIGRGIGAIRGINGYPTAYIRAVLEHNLDRLLVAATGSTFPNVGKDLLNNFEVNVCSPEQAQQANKLLVGIEDKRYLNSQTNQTLEEMAQAIFKSWFVDFDPVKAKINGDKPEGMDEATASLFPEKLVESELGLIPEGWDVGTLSDVAKYCSARTKTDSITLENYISTENMLAEKKGVTAASKLPTAKTVAAYKSGDILVSNIRPYFKKIWLAEVSGGRSNDVLGFESVSANTESYLMNVLYQDTFFEYMTRTSKGAKMPRGDKTAIMNWEMAVPPVELREAFSAIVDKFYQLIPQNRAQNATLESLRDTLLPKLLSGELSLTDSLEVTNV